MWEHPQKNKNKNKNPARWKIRSKPTCKYVTKRTFWTVQGEMICKYECLVILYFVFRHS